MIDHHIYDQDITYPTFDKAKERKEALKKEGFRVKIRKTEVGYVVYKKNRELLDFQSNRKGNRRGDKKWDRDKESFQMSSNGA